MVRRHPHAPYRFVDLGHGRLVGPNERLTEWDGVAYVILSYKLPGQVARLVETIKRESPRSAIVIHHDDHNVALGPLPRTDGVFLCSNPRHLPWGTWELAACMLDATRWAHRHLAVEWVSILSGQDWPVMGLEAAEHRLATSGMDGFVQADPIGWTLRGSRPAPEADHKDWLMLRRYLFRYYTLPVERPAALTRRGIIPDPLPVTDVDQGNTAAAEAVPMMLRAKRAVGRVNERRRWVALSEVPTTLDIGVRNLVTPFDAEHPVWFGSCWFDLSRRALDRMLALLDPSTSYHRYFRRTEIAEEAMFATAVCNDPTLEIVSDDNHRHLRFPTTWAPNPVSFGTADLDELMASGATFARKFDTDQDHEVIDALEARRNPNVSDVHRRRRAG